MLRKIRDKFDFCFRTESGKISIKAVGDVWPIDYRFFQEGVYASNIKCSWKGPHLHPKKLDSSFILYGTQENSINSNKILIDFAADFHSFLNIQKKILMLLS